MSRHRFVKNLTQDDYYDDYSDEDDYYQEEEQGNETKITIKETYNPLYPSNS